MATLDLIAVILAVLSRADVIGIIVGLTVILFSCVFHECAHGYVAYRRGDPTARDLGRLTLNPIPHIDPVMTILVPIISYLTMHVAFGGAKPVPVNPYNLRHPRRDMMLVALAGPLSNLLLAVTAAGLLHLGAWRIPVIADLLQMGVIINVLLAVFNLVPIPPLDGSRVASYFMSDEAAEQYARIEPFGLFIVVFLLAYIQAFNNMLFGMVDFFTNLLMKGHYL